MAYRKPSALTLNWTPEGIAAYREASNLFAVAADDAPLVNYLVQTAKKYRKYTKTPLNDKALAYVWKNILLNAAMYCALNAKIGSTPSEFDFAFDTSLFDDRQTAALKNAAQAIHDASFDSEEGRLLTNSAIIEGTSGPFQMHDSLAVAIYRTARSLRDL